MNIQNHLDKITWSLADKGLFIGYGLVQLFQMRSLGPEEFGMFGLLIGIYTWLFVVCDGFALQSIIQFGMNESNRGKVNLLSLISILTIVIVGTSLLYFFSGPVSIWLNEPRIERVGEMLPVLSLLTIPRIFTIKLVNREMKYNRLFFINFAYFGTMSIMTLYFINTSEVFTFTHMYEIYVAGTAVSSLAGIIIMIKHLKFSFAGNITFKKIFAFSLPYGMQTSLHSLPRNLDIWFLKIFFATEALGIYQSAKTLFRLFDEANNAGYGLIYPAALKRIEKKDYSGLNDIMTKSVSFLLLVFATLIVFLELGLTEFIVNTFLSTKYVMATGQFNLLVLAALILPFTILTGIITAFNKPRIVLLFVVISDIICFATFFIIGKSMNEAIIPLGIIAYNLSLGLLSFYYVKRNYGFKVNMIFRSVNDSLNFAKKILKKGNK